VIKLRIILRRHLINRKEYVGINTDMVIIVSSDDLQIRTDSWHLFPRTSLAKQRDKNADSDEWGGDKRNNLVSLSTT